jgi:hypothetical protein
MTQTASRQQAAEYFRSTVDLILHVLMHITRNHSALKSDDKAGTWLDGAQKVLGSPPEHTADMRLTADVLNYGFDLRRQQLIHGWLQLFKAVPNESILQLIEQMVRFHGVAGESLDQTRRRLTALVENFNEAVRGHPLAAEYESFRNTILPTILIESVLAIYSGKGRHLVQVLTEQCRALLARSPRTTYTTILSMMTKLVEDNRTVVTGDRKLYNTTGSNHLTAERKAIASRHALMSTQTTDSKKPNQLTVRFDANP